MTEENYADKWLREDFERLLEIKKFVDDNPEKKKLMDSVYGNGNLDALIGIKVNLINIQKLYRECERIALENGVVFFYTPGPDYGMGGIYKIPNGEYPNEEGWHSSNAGC